MRVPETYRLVVPLFLIALALGEILTALSSAINRYDLRIPLCGVKLHFKFNRYLVRYSFLALLEVKP